MTVMLRDERGRPLKEIDPQSIADGHVLIPVVHEGQDRTILLSDLVECLIDIMWNGPIGAGGEVTPFVEDIFGPAPKRRTSTANGVHGMNWIRQERRLALYIRDGWHCAYCGCCLRESKATLDHVRPRHKGGTNANRNLVTSCLPCNSRRQGRSLREWLPAEALVRVRRLVRRRVPLQLAKDIRAGLVPYPVSHMNVGA